MLIKYNLNNDYGILTSRTLTELWKYALSFVIIKISSIKLGDIFNKEKVEYLNYTLL